MQLHNKLSESGMWTFELYSLLPQILFHLTNVEEMFTELIVVT